MEPTDLASELCTMQVRLLESWRATGAVLDETWQVLEKTFAQLQKAREAVDSHTQCCVQTAIRLSVLVQPATSV